MLNAIGEKDNLPALEDMTIVLVGDKAKVMERIGDKLGYDIVELNADGEPDNRVRLHQYD